jgi:ABC-type transport system involved in multi-copper enzyme maturation permease subunit
MNAILARTLALTVNTFTEAVRQRFFAFLLLLAALLAGGGAFLRTFNFGNSELKFTADFGFGGMFFFGTILAIVMTAQLFFSELDNRTALPLLARPVRRWEFFLGKFLGAWALLAVFTALLTIVLLALLLPRSLELAAAAQTAGEPPPAFSLPGLLAGAALQWLRLGIVAALTLLVCSFAQTFLYAVVVSTLAMLTCQLQGIAREIFSRAHKDSVVADITNTLGRAIPDLQIFDLGATLALPSQNPGQDTIAAFSAFATGMLQLPVLLLLAVFFFSSREL